MKGTLLNLSPNGIHYLRAPYNMPESWNYEGYDFTCNNGHAHVMITVHEYYFRQYSDYNEYSKAHIDYQGPRTRIGYVPIGMNNFDGTVKFARLLLGFSIDKNYHANFVAEFGRTPYMYAYHMGNPYLEEFRIECSDEWLSWDPDKIIQMMKLTLQEHDTEFKQHFAECEEWDES